jgi:hypothetical protein
MEILRDIIRREIEKEVLKQFYGNNWHDVPENERIRKIAFLHNRKYLDQMVDNILLDLFSTMNFKPFKKKKSIFSVLCYTSINLISIPIITYCVNREIWVCVVGLTLILIVIAAVFINLSLNND